MVNDKELATDFMMDTFVRFSKKYSEEIQDHELVKKRLYTIAGNLIKDHYRKKKVRMTYANSCDTNSSISIENSVFSKLDVQIIRDAVSKKKITLKDCEKEVYHCLFVLLIDPKKPSDISDVSGLDYKAVTYAKRTLFKKIREFYSE